MITMMPLEGGRPSRDDANVAEKVYAFNDKQEAQAFAAKCTGWRKKRVLSRSLKSGGLSFEVFTVNLWR